jgi:hypothetical protein
MSITVYWACTEDQWMMAEKPESVTSIFYSKNIADKTDTKMSLQYCPAFNDNLTNVYALRSIYDYEFSISNNEVSTNYYDQNFFEKHVHIRSLEKRFFSFRNSYIFFTDCEDLEVTFYEFPFLEDNNITKNCIPITGKFNIGKWFRNTEYAFLLKKNADTFKIEKSEIFCYIRFHTDKKINFKQFRYTDKLDAYNKDGFNLNFYGYLKKLENYYKMFRQKKLVLDEIKRNLL